MNLDQFIEKFIESKEKPTKSMMSKLEDIKRIISKETLNWTDYQDLYDEFLKNSDNYNIPTIKQLLGYIKNIKSNQYYDKIDKDKKIFNMWKECPHCNGMRGYYNESKNTWSWGCDPCDNTGKVILLEVPEGYKHDKKTGRCWMPLSKESSRMFNKEIENFIKKQKEVFI